MAAAHENSGSGDSGGGDNPLKDQGQTKATTTAKAAQAKPEGSARADTAHPSQHGGVTRSDPAGVDIDNAGPRGQMRTTDSGVKKAGPSPTDEPRSARTGTLPNEGQGGLNRTGKTKNDRQNRNV
ncbi:MAG: hypothetical protein SFZ23_09145 [Planctomycetota bacterium]|nr:hypothetical protein [Planctomycetota bacterium]